MWLSSVVLPEPRKPVSTVTGTRESDEDDILDGRVTADDAVRHKRVLIVVVETRSVSKMTDPIR
jgi:hypothetical protein